jgi:hypothetical protein
MGKDWKRISLANRLLSQNSEKQVIEFDAWLDKVCEVERIENRNFSCRVI